MRSAAAALGVLAATRSVTETSAWEAAGEALHKKSLKYRRGFEAFRRGAFMEDAASNGLVILTALSQCSLHRPCMWMHNVFMWLLKKTKKKKKKFNRNTCCTLQSLKVLKVYCLYKNM
jgi:hypothetical protein